MIAVFLPLGVKALAQNQFHVIFSSDPQYPWSEQPKSEEQTKEDSKKEISSQYKSMTKLASDSASGTRVNAVIVNGDLTAFGHGWQLDEYKNLLANNLHVPNR